MIRNKYEITVVEFGPRLKFVSITSSVLVEQKYLKDHVGKPSYENRNAQKQRKNRQICLRIPA